MVLQVKAVSWVCFLLAQLHRRSTELLALLCRGCVLGVQPALLQHTSTYISGACSALYGPSGVTTYSLSREQKLQRKGLWVMLTSPAGAPWGAGGWGAWFLHTGLCASCTWCLCARASQLGWVMVARCSCRHFKLMCRFVDFSTLQCSRLLLQHLNVKKILQRWYISYMFFGLCNPQTKFSRSSEMHGGVLKFSAIWGRRAGFCVFLSGVRSAYGLLHRSQRHCGIQLLREYLLFWKRELNMLFKG